MKEGLFGGTFNPLHNGHIKVITHVKKAFAIDRIHLIPSAVPPHKPIENLAPARDRLEMIQKTVASIPGLCASDLEIRRTGPSFTIDTVTQFINTTDHDTDPYFILGTDAFFDMDTWKQTCEIFEKTNIIIMTRAGERRKLRDIADFLASQVPCNYDFDRASMTFSHPELKAVHLCNPPEIQISSTAIRHRVKNNQSIDSLVPEPVENIIIKKGLYL
ncbi:nicotinate-nucleotide adenylyltransferase [Desulfocicer vacuolatum DSM 3385]|uniref:Probable nicotinate-nucleotide adenylyltransferase n=1 Tax=Desulfocicer vacuolatum DSM 3385 TaxID=1121400 RepID=A0A1W2DA42_9BACT|nr:nicotinate-nucleotide adenylyltransferase [Desulfocicer vacuolatum]SMC94371.1 nicotinate-nucleotide adenylyltransferase [Desulfocicer vacuolatum DSM 3385]